MRVLERVAPVLGASAVGIAALQAAGATANLVAAAQTLGAAGPLTLNGALASGGSVYLFGQPSKLSLTSTGNLSGINFTITGTPSDYDGDSPTTEILAGPNNATVQSLTTWRTVTSIVANAAVGTNVTAGLYSGQLKLTALPVVLAPARKVVLATTADLHLTNFTIIGTDRNGNPITEVLAGPNNATTTSKYIYGSVISITPSVALAANQVSAGWTTDVYTPWISLANFVGNYTWWSRVFFPVGGVVNYDVECTSENILKDQIVGDAVDDLKVLAAALTVPSDSVNLVPFAAIRIHVNSADSPVTLRVIPSRTA